jgi:hypothetical protein
MLSSKPITLIALTAILLGLAAAGCTQNSGSDSSQKMNEMSKGMQMAPDSLQNMKLAPLVKAYHEGGDAYFIHTEASDSKVARMLTKMMGPNVVHLSKLAQTPNSLLADIYVFKNGIEGNGPFGYQPDIIASVPGDSDYSPLRSIHLVSWNEQADPRELKMMEALMQAQSNGELTIEEAGIVVNMPVLVWPGGHR